MITKDFYETTEKGEKADKYTLTAGLYSAVITTYGGILIALHVPDKTGNIDNVILSLENLSQYEESSPYFGAIIGRVANRIGNAHFSLDGVEYLLDKNNGKAHTLHGGFNGFDRQIFKAKIDESAKNPTIHLFLESKDGDGGFPGSVMLEVIYSLSSEGSLSISYKAHVDKRTPLNLTNHAYFNLKGKEDILDHLLTLNCDRYLPVDEGLIPTGVIAPVANTAFDFTTSKEIRQDIDKIGGYDHCMIVKESGDITTPIAVVKEITSGRVMRVYTTLEAVQFYSGNFLDGSIKSPKGFMYEKYAGFCLETQHYPDAVNHPNFPSTIYDENNGFEHTTIYSFSVEG